MKAEQRGCGRERPALVESGGGGAVEEEVQKGGSGGAAAAAPPPRGGEVWVLQAKEAADAEEVGMGDVALHKMPHVGLVAE